MKKQYIMPTIQVVVLDCLCTSLNTCSVVSGPNNDTKETFEVNEDNEDSIFGVENCGGD